MKQADVQIGATYTAKVSGRLARVRILSTSSLGGWCAVNRETLRAVRIKSAQRLRRLVESPGGPVNSADEQARRSERVRARLLASGLY